MAFCDLSQLLFNPTGGQTQSFPVKFSQSLFAVGITICPGWADHNAKFRQLVSSHLTNKQLHLCPQNTYISDKQTQCSSHKERKSLMSKWVLLSFIGGKISLKQWVKLTPFKERSSCFCHRRLGLVFTRFTMGRWSFSVDPSHTSVYTAERIWMWSERSGLKHVFNEGPQKLRCNQHLFRFGEHPPRNKSHRLWLLCLFVVTLHLFVVIVCLFCVFILSFYVSL